MMDKSRKFFSGVIFLFLSILMCFGFFESDISINIIAGKESEVVINSLFKNGYLCQTEEVIYVNGELESQYEIKNEKNLIFLSKKEGKYKFSWNILNGIPVKDITVNVIPDVSVYAGGDVVGVKMKTSGVIVVGFEEITTAEGDSVSPGVVCGLKEGDVITKINGTQIDSADEFKKVLNRNTSKNCTLEVRRSGKTFEVKLNPVKALSDGSLKAGIWVRDNIAGIGTVTCISEDKTKYAALGHAVTDSSTGINVPVSEGSLMQIDIISLNRGEKNKPGEIKGVFDSSEKTLGSIRINNDYGIYGSVLSSVNFDSSSLYPVALQNEIETGEAFIISDISGEKCKYSISIEKISVQTAKKSKSMLIKITDEKLLEETGGIIQGMSGSPIIQNGKIVGAVTHVMISDPTRGYGVFIEWMLEDLLFCQN